MSRPTPISGDAPLGFTVTMPDLIRVGQALGLRSTLTPDSLTFTGRGITITLPIDKEPDDVR